MVADLVTFLGGDTAPLERDLERGHAARRRPPSTSSGPASLRDKLEAVRAADAVRQMELDRPEDLDVLGLAEDELEAAVQVFHVRSGRVVGRSALFVDKVEDLTPDELVERLLVDVYADAGIGGAPPGPGPDHARRPRRGLRVPGGRAGAARWSSGCRCAARSGPCSRPCERNAGEAFVRHRLQRTSDHNSRARALEALQRELGLPDAPLRIECYDMSHLQGTDYVGSMVVFEDGLPKKSDYRHFKVATVRRQRRLRGHGGGADPPADRPARGGARPGPGPATSRRGGAGPRHAGDSPTRPSCCWSTAGLGQLHVGDAGARARWG